MTLSEIQSRLDAIIDATDDPEAAHALEDALHRDVLMAIAEGRYGACGGEPVSLARAAMLSQHIQFPRWTA